MVEIYDAHEQGEVVKRWLQQNGGAIIVGVVIAFGGLFGVKQWQAWQISSKQEAYAEFQAMNGLLSDGQLDAAFNNYQTLQEDYAKSPYASLAALQMGRARLEAKQPDLAIMHYRFVIDNGQPKAIRIIARDRLARVLLDQGQAAEALTVIEGETQLEGFEARTAETRGDILQALDRKEDAIAAYQAALEALEPGAGDRETLVLKLENLGVVPSDKATTS